MTTEETLTDEEFEKCLLMIFFLSCWHMTDEVNSLILFFTSHLISSVRVILFNSL